ncbi:hypothetical protein [Moritella sp. 28]|uniref:hypothetical protein n=1 Tax=Moritella sp. 28 TaxID=2746232 RepID=UPI001BAAD92D|nr:hypothetical protein [Moritella sp. 28]QUM85313.1 hypothetical protein HWV02_12775 [Moritella sp. 28]
MNARDYAEGLSDAVRRQWSFQVKSWGKRHVYPQLPNYVQVTPAASKEFQQPEMSLIENAMFQSNPRS